MRVDLLYVQDCPHRRLARHRLDRALARTGLPVVVQERQIDTSEEAARLGMRGSPTILIDGQDPFAPSDVPGSLSCRLYRCGAGLGGAPSVSQLIKALGD